MRFWRKRRRPPSGSLYYCVRGIDGVLLRHPEIRPADHILGEFTPTFCHEVLGWPYAEQWRIWGDDRAATR